MKYIMFAWAIIIGSLFHSQAYAGNADNQYHKDCLSLYGYDVSAPLEERMAFNHFNKAAACVTALRNKDHKQWLADIRKFLKENPEYRIPGGSAGMPHPWAEIIANRLHDIEALRNGKPTNAEKRELRAKGLR